MTEIEEGSLKFSFPKNLEVSKYDEWSFYRNRFQSVASGSKAVDIVCLDKRITWLIEIKDYRQNPRQKTSDLDEEIASKVRDTLAGLAAAGANANDASEKQFAQRALAKRKWKIVLHLEQPNVISRLRPRPYNVADLLSKLRSKNLKAVDAHPVVASMNTPSSTIPWDVRKR